MTIIYLCHYIFGNNTAVFKTINIREYVTLSKKVFSKIIKSMNCTFWILIRTNKKHPILQHHIHLFKYNGRCRLINGLPRYK